MYCSLLKPTLAIVAIVIALNTQAQENIDVFIWAGQSNADLPDAMTFFDGSSVRTTADWEKRKKEIKNLWCDYFIGHYPKSHLSYCRQTLSKPKKKRMVQAENGWY